MSKVELLEKVRAYKVLQMFIKQMEEEAEGLKATITAEMEASEADVMTVDVFTIRYTTVKSNRFDTTAFKKTHNDLYEQYTKESVSKRFIVA